MFERIGFYVLVGLVAAGVSLVLSFAIWRLSKRFRLYPAIRARDVHTTPTPRLGGVAMFIGLVAAVLVASQFEAFDLVFADPTQVGAVLGAALLIVAIGVADDLLDLDWTIKLAAQIGAAAILALGGIQLVNVPIGGVTILSPALSLGLTVFVVVLVMNAVNFIDGLDGLVAGTALISNVVFFIYVYLLQYDDRTSYFNLATMLTVALGGALAGFLVLNWHPAKLFMGDAGALLTGLIMAASAISVTSTIDPMQIAATQPGVDETGLLGRSDLVPALIPIVLPIAILVVPLLDFGLAVTRRLHAGKSPFSADRKHLHHRLLDMGHSHFHAVLIFYGWAGVVAIGCLLPLFVHWGWAIAFIVVGLVVCTGVTVAPITWRKAREVASQNTATGQIDVVQAAYDPLDAAAATLDTDPAHHDVDAGAAPPAPRRGPEPRRETP